MTVNLKRQLRHFLEWLGLIGPKFDWREPEGGA